MNITITREEVNSPPDDD